MKTIVYCSSFGFFAILNLLAGNIDNISLSNLGSDANNWNLRYSACVGVYNGFMQIIADTGRPMIYSPKTNLDTETTKFISFKMKLESGIDCPGHIHFVTDKNPTWNDEASVSFKVVGTGKIEGYQVDMTKNPLWQGTVTQLRLMYNRGRNYRFNDCKEKYFELGCGFTGMEKFVWQLDKYDIPFRASRTCIPVHYSDWRDIAFSQIMKKRNVDAQIVFFGDSITQLWTFQREYENGSKFWETEFVPLNVQNFALAGDKTQNLLWQITAGKSLDNMNPKLFVIMIGINNIIHGDSVEDISIGIKYILNVLQKTHPDSKILLLGQLPNRVAWDKNKKISDKTTQLNNVILKYADDKHIFYFDSTKVFMDKNYKLNMKFLRDGLHLTEAGYGEWAAFLRPYIMELLKENKIDKTSTLPELAGKTKNHEI